MNDNENIESNFVRRVASVNDRFVLLSLLADLGKCLKESKLSSSQYVVVVKALLKRISVSLFGQLTANEFNNNFCCLFTITRERFARETIGLLVQALSEVDHGNTYQLQKIVDITDSIIGDLLRSLLTQPTRNSDYRRQIEDTSLSQIICSFSDRLFNYFGNDDTKNYAYCENAARKHEHNIISSIQGFLTCPGAIHMNMSLCAKLIADFAAISPSFTESLVKWVLANIKLMSFPPFRLFLDPNMDSRKQERLLIAIFLAVEDGKQLSVIFEDAVLYDPLLKRLLTRKLLLERVSPFAFALSAKASPLGTAQNGALRLEQNVRASRKIAEYFQQLPSTQMTLDTFRQLVRVFADQSRLLNAVGFDQQLQTAVAVIDFAKILSQSDISVLRDHVTVEFASLVPEYLKLPDNCRRQVGMFVAEFVMNLFVADGTNKLKFDYNSDATLKELKQIANEDEQCAGADGSENAVPSTSNATATPPTRPTLRHVDARTQLLDSDDDEESADGDRLLETELSEHQSQEQNRPYYLRDCLECITAEKENYKNFAVALRALPTLIRAHAVGFDDLALDILDQMICLEDRFRLPDFQELRKKSATLVLAKRPDLVAHSVRVLFSQQCSMTIRFFILGCLDDAAALLAGEKSLDGDDEKEKSNNEGASNMECSRPPGELGRIIRRTNAKTTPKGRKNLFFEVVPQFIFPLLNVTNVGSHLDLYDRDSILLGKILSSVGAMIAFARCSPHLPPVIGSVLTLLRALQNNPQTFVISGCLFCYAAIADSSLIRECFNVELNDALEWMGRLMDAQETQTSAADPIYRETLYVSFIKLRELIHGADTESG